MTSSQPGLSLPVAVISSLKFLLFFFSSFSLAHGLEWRLLWRLLLIQEERCFKV
jgi:hypothetical protein